MNVPVSCLLLAAGLLAQWNFDEGTGHVVHDSSGNGHDAKLGGARWITQGDGFALSLNGPGQHVRGPLLTNTGLTGPVSVEAWVKPVVKGHGEAHLLGVGMRSFVLTYYNAELCYWYIGDGGNNVRGALTLHGWNHVVGAFDGKTMTMWINGRQVGQQESKAQKYALDGVFTIGDPGESGQARFKGGVDSVRLYNRALSAEEVVAHFKREAGAYGFDRRWFERVRVNPFYYFDPTGRGQSSAERGTVPVPSGQGRIVLEADYKGLQPLRGAARIEASLSLGDKVVHRERIETLPESGEAEIVLPTAKWADGRYVIRLTLTDEAGARPVEELTFPYPPPPLSLPAPKDRTAPALPARPGPTPFQFRMGKTGGFTLTVAGAEYPFQTRVSWPRGEFNQLADAPATTGEKSWQVSIQDQQVEARGDFYKLRREIQVFPTHVSVKDTFTNLTTNDLGLFIYHETPAGPGQIERSFLGGFEGPVRAEAGTADLFSPSVFVTDSRTGLGIVPVDDVFIVQSVLYNEPRVVGLGTEKFALAPGASHTLEWAVYPTGSKDYYDFVNAFRTVEGRIGTVDGGLGFITYGPMNRRQVPGEEFFERRGIKYAILHSMGRAADDPQVSLEGVEFMDFPKEMDLLRRQATAFHHRHPLRKIMFHIAHSLYLTPKPERFADSRVIGADGKQAVWQASEPYVTKQRQREGWTWWIYYPTPGNRFHDLLLKSVDVMMDELGMDGAFMDGFNAGYQGQWTYDGRWDGHSAEIDRATKTITRKIGSVLLLSQPSMLEFARKIRDKGGVVIANNTMLTRSIANEKHIIFDQEVASGPHLHFGPSVTALGRGPFASEKEIYLDMLDKLAWGELFAYYLERLELAGPSLAAFQYPMTFEEIRAGLVRGPQRIVTSNPGVYGWPGSRDLHLVRKFDARGVPAAHSYLTTVDAGSVRTELRFEKNESAVIEKIPVQIEAAAPVNALVTRYTGDGCALLLHGQGDATLNMFVGTTYPDKRAGVFKDGGINPADIQAGDLYRVTVNGKTETRKEIDGTLLVPLTLAGETNISITRNP